MDTLLNRFESVLIHAAVLSNFIMMCLTTVDAAGRYLLNRPITGAYEITANYLMVAAVFLAASYAYRRGAYLRVTLLADRLPKRIQAYVNVFVQVASMLYGVALVAATAKHAVSNVGSGSTLSSLNFPVGPAYVIVPVGLFFMSLFMLLDIRKVKKGHSPLFKEELPTP